ncbi:hypothetical protein GCM10027168_35230 [Streptomyces capparidis]
MRESGWLDMAAAWDNAGRPPAPRVPWLISASEPSRTRKVTVRVCKVTWEGGSASRVGST